MSDVALLIHRPLVDQLLAPADRARLEAAHTVRCWLGDQPASVEEAADLLAGCQAAIGSWGTVNPGRPGVLDRCPGLRLWVHAAGSVKSFFTGELAKAPQLVISSCKDAIAAGVAEQTVACLTLGLRNWFANADANRSGRVGKPAPCRLLGESTIGLIGASAVGRLVVTRLRAEGCRILVHDPFLDAAGAAALGVELMPDLRELCRRSDAISLHTPLLESTRNLLRGEHFAALPDHSVVVNTSRGECLDQEALLAELVSGRLSACLDVTFPEPLPDDHPLRRLPNCHITSHIAGPPSRLIGRQAVDDVLAVLAGGRPRSPIHADMLAHIA